MDIIDLHKRTNIKPAAGKFLIAEPFLSDPGFSRTVVFLCEHGADGSIGFILNRPSKSNIGDLLPELYNPKLTIYDGGPVQNDTLHMVHKMPELMGGLEITPGIYWGGSYNDLSKIIGDQDFPPEAIRLFIGYSGWETGQLEKELEDGAWLVADSLDRIIFETQPTQIWQRSIRSLGPGFSHLANMPLHPQLN